MKSWRPCAILYRIAYTRNHLVCPVSTLRITFRFAVQPQFGSQNGDSTVTLVTQEDGTEPHQGWEVTEITVLAKV
jgi:hypothetical protein